MNETHRLKSSRCFSSNLLNIPLKGPKWNGKVNNKQLYSQRRSPIIEYSRPLFALILLRILRTDFIINRKVWWWCAVRRNEKILLNSHWLSVLSGENEWVLWHWPHTDPPTISSAGLQFEVMPDWFWLVFSILLPKCK